MSIANTVIAYHGCDVTVRDDLVSGRLHRLDHSNNDYDWLGPGAYFFEGDVERAFFFARASHDNPEKLYTDQYAGAKARLEAALARQRKPRIRMKR